MKRINIIILAVFLSFFSSIKVYGANTFSLENASLECIYEDGSIMYFYYYDGKGMVGRDYIPGGGTKQSMIEGRSFIAHKNESESAMNAEYLKCPDKVYRSVYEINNDRMITFCFEEHNFDPIGDLNELILSSFGTLSNGLSGLTKVSDAWGGEYNLLSENIMVQHNNVTPSLSCDYIHRKGQILGSNVYINVSRYKNGQVILEQSNKVTNIIEGLDLFSGNKCPDEIYINDSDTYFNNSTISPRYEYTHPRFAVSKIQNDKTYHHFSLLVDENKDASTTSENIDVCKDIPNTIILIRDFIKILSILVPIILIFASSIEFFKTIYSGNINEDLKNTFSHFKYRILLVVIFFFLPSIMNLLMELLSGAGIIPVSDLNCLFK